MLMTGLVLVFYVENFLMQNTNNKRDGQDGLVG
jgi:hypothetical protein